MRFTALWGLVSAYSRDTGRPALPLLEHSHDRFLVAIHDLVGIAERCYEGRSPLPCSSKPVLHESSWQLWFWPV
jgi:hypothetical protein